MYDVDICGSSRVVKDAHDILLCLIQLEVNVYRFSVNT